MADTKKRHSIMKRLLEKYPPNSEITPYHITAAEQEADTYDEEWAPDLEDDADAESLISTDLKSNSTSVSDDPDLEDADELENDDVDDMSEDGEDAD